MARTAAPARPRTFGRASSRTDSFEIISAPPTHPASRLAGLVIRLRAELFVLALCLTVWFGLRAHLSLTATITVLALVLAVLAGVPHSRRFLTRRAAAVITRHRLRQTLVECRVVNFSRACPVFLWSHPTRVGETVWLFLRAGICADDVADQAAWIAAGCFAREARVTARTSMTALVRVEVIRRDPLSAESIGSDLAPWASGWDSPIVPVGAIPEQPHGHTPDPAPFVIDSPPADSPSASTPADGDDAGEPPARGGDWSDYV